MTRHSRSLSLAVFIAGAAVLSCSKDTTSPSMVAAVVVTPGGDTLATLGRTRQFTGVAQDASGHPVSGASLVWHSTNPAVATVDSVTGLVTAVGNGLALVRATASGVTGEGIVVVSQAVATVTVTPPTATLTTVGATTQFSAVAKDSGGSTISGVALLWISSDPTVAIVDTTGRATSQKSGHTTVTAAARGVPGNAVLTVNQVLRALVFTVAPSATVAGEALNPAVQVEVRDSAGSLVTSSRASITLGLGKHPGGAVLHGSTTVDAVGGIATFSGLTIEQADTQYTLTATTGGIPVDSSALFAVVPAAVTQVVISVPDSAVDGAPLSPAPTVSLYDRFGNFASNATDTVFLEVAASAWGGHLAGNTTAVSIGGVATFPGARWSDPGSFTLRARSGAGIDIAASPTIQHIHFIQIATSGTHTCGTTAAGLFCWGENDQFQLGNGTTAGDSVPTLVDPSVTLTKVGTGQLLTCGLTAAGAAYCWGNNLLGPPSSVPTLVPGGLLFSLLGVGGDDQCGLTGGGVAYCWGANYYGALGDSTATGSLSPVAVHGGQTFTSIAGGGDYTCGLAVGGSAFCWGYNLYGQLGNGTVDSSLVPTAVLGGLTFSGLGVGGGHACGLVAGAAYCWGSGYTGQTGDTLFAARDTVPLAVPGGLTFSNIAAGGAHTCAIALPGPTYCWGDNFFGELGSASLATALPVQVTGGHSFLALTAGSGISCGLVSGGRAYCWGSNSTGALGDGTMTNRNVPTPVVQ